MQTQLCCHISFSTKKTPQHKKSYFSLCNKTSWLKVFAFHLFFSEFWCVCFLFSIFWYHIHPQVHHQHDNLSYQVLLYVLYLTPVICFLCIPIRSHPSWQGSRFVTQSFVFHTYSMFPSLHLWTFHLPSPNLREKRL